MLTKLQLLALFHARSRPSQFPFSLAGLRMTSDQFDTKYQKHFYLKYKQSPSLNRETEINQNIIEITHNHFSMMGELVKGNMCCTVWLTVLGIHVVLFQTFRIAWPTFVVLSQQYNYIIISHWSLSLRSSETSYEARRFPLNCGTWTCQEQL